MRRYLDAGSDRTWFKVGRGALPRRGGVPRPMFRMFAPITHRDPELHGLTHELGALVTEHFFCLPVDQLDTAVWTRDRHSVGNGFKEPGEARLHRWLSGVWSSRVLTKDSVHLRSSHIRVVGFLECTAHLAHSLGHQTCRPFNRIIYYQMRSSCSRPGRVRRP